MPQSAPTDDATIRRDILAAIKRSQGYVPPWLAEVLPVVRFRLDKTTNAPKHHDGRIEGAESDVYLASGEINVSMLGQLVHELWHAYLNLIVKTGRSRAAREIRAEFEKTKQRQDRYRGLVRDADDFTPDSMELGDFKLYRLNVPRRLWLHNTAGDAHEMADELWGNYIQNALVAATNIANDSRFEAEAQVFWDAWLRSNANGLTLPSTYTAELKKVYGLGGDVGQFIRLEVLGLDDKVARWPPEFRRWEKRRSTSQGALIADALERANAHRDSDSRLVLERFLRNWIPRDASLRPYYSRLNSPQIIVKQTSSWADLGVRDGGGYHTVMVCPARWASRGAGSYTKIDFVILSAELPRVMAPAAPR